MRYLWTLISLIIIAVIIAEICFIYRFISTPQFETNTQVLLIWSFVIFAITGLTICYMILHLILQKEKHLADKERQENDIAEMRKKEAFEKESFEKQRIQKNTEFQNTIENFEKRLKKIEEY